MKTVHQKTLAMVALLTGSNLCLYAQSPPSPAINNSVLVSWVDPSEEQIVVGADSIDGRWTPWHEPCFQHDGKACMATPAIDAQHYFKTVPGIQFSDDFAPAKPPFSGKLDWSPGFYSLSDASRWLITNVNDVLQIQTVPTATHGQVALLPPGPDLVVEDFFAAVDIVDWPVKGVSFGLSARIWRDPDVFPGTSNGLIGLVKCTTEPSNPEVIGQLSIWNGSTETIGPSFTYDPATDYRLAFSGSGNLLTLRIVNLTTGDEVVQRNASNNQYKQGLVGLWVDAGIRGTMDISLDNYFVAGTTPQKD